MITVLATVTCTIMLWSLWIRRHTWKCRWERASTIGVTLLTADLLLLFITTRSMSPAVACDDLRFHLANIFELAGMCAIVRSAVAKLSTDEEMPRWAVRHLRLPGLAGLALLTSLFITDHLDTYRVVYSMLTDYLLYSGALAFIDLWYDKPSRRLVSIHMVAAVVAAISANARILTVLGWEMWDVVIVTRSLAAAIFAFGVAYAWILRVQWFTSRPGWSGLARARFRPDLHGDRRSQPLP